MSDELTYGISLLVVGMGAVFVALSITGLMVALVSRMTQAKPAPAVPSASLPEEDLAGGGIDRHKIVLLAAAATVAVKRPVRIRRVRLVSRKQTSTLWGVASRPDHVHKTRH
jgi:Na+-transporting methylmalonyl-CoA/oxaloacetate decarboxylase gamma subunit